MRIRLILLFLVSLPGLLPAQQYFFKQFSVSEGLAQSTIFQVIQDSDGLYWIGTEAGVSTFDGKVFTNYSSADGLAENGVRALCADRDGQIWLGHTGGGLSRYRDSQFERIHLPDSIFSSSITSMALDSMGQLWITTLSDGVIEIPEPVVAAQDLLFRQFSGSVISDVVFSAQLNTSGELYFVTDPHIKRYTAQQDTFISVSYPGVSGYAATTCLLFDTRERVWVGKYNGGLFCHDQHNGESRMIDLIEEEGMLSNWISTLLEDREGNIWIGTWGGGLARIDTLGVLKHFDDLNGLPGLRIRCLMQDREGNILVGTQEQGLAVFRGEQVVNYFAGKNGLRNSQVWSVLQRANGSIWAGTSQGISIIDGAEKGSGIRNYPHLESERILFLEEDSRGSVWIGTQGVFRYDRRGQQHFDPLINNNIHNLDVTAMEIDSRDQLWIGTLDGLIYYEIRGRKIARLSQGNGLLGNEISTVYADSRNRIWIGSTGRGINLIEGDSILTVDLDFAFTPRCFVEDLDGNIWVGTEGRGVLLLDSGGRQIIQEFDEGDGLLTRLINQLNCDRYNNVYIGTNKGLNVYQRSDKKIYAFTPGSGFVGIETKPNASIRDEQGRLWFGTVAGLTRYSPEPGGLNVQEPATQITRIQVNHEPISLEQGQSFSHRENSFIFEYRCISMNSDALLFQYMLEGVDADWRAPESQNRVTYPALRHGNYTFLLKARSSEGVWNKEAIAFSFEIRPPLYLTWYFILSMVLLTGLAVFSYILLRTRALRRENIILENRVKDRTAVVVAQKEELAQKNKDITDSIRYAKRIQFALLPEHPPYEDTFVLFKPKDIVSGDFYWFQQAGDREFLAAVDCTGHGVPGALMSIIGHNSLTKIVREYGILDPGEILRRLDQEVIATLSKRTESTEVLDGMDLALVSYLPVEGILEYAGAFNPLYLVRDGELLEWSADKASIGRSSVLQDKEYRTQRIEIQKGDCIYLFSDGYADQFGGPQMKKFKYRQMKELFVRIHGESMTQQQLLLNQTIEEWKGSVQQLDDILIVGRRF